jgi:hypothetical protein
MQSVGWISDLKLRASTGKLGNQEIDNYAFLTLLRRQGDQYLISRYGNPDLKWETTRQTNVGLDMGVLSPTLFAMLVIMALVTTFSTTPLLNLIVYERGLADAPPSRARVRA